VSVINRKPVQTEQSKEWDVFGLSLNILGMDKRAQKMTQDLYLFIFPLRWQGSLCSNCAQGRQMSL
jgi:hypothetical protein